MLALNTLSLHSGYFGDSNKMQYIPFSSYILKIKSKSLPQRNNAMRFYEVTAQRFRKCNVLIGCPRNRTF